MLINYSLYIGFMMHEWYAISYLYALTLENVLEFGRYFMHFKNSIKPTLHLSLPLF